MMDANVYFQKTFILSLLYAKEDTPDFVIAWRRGKAHAQEYKLNFE